MRPSITGTLPSLFLISLPDFPRHAHKCLHYEPAVKLAEPKIIKQEPDNPFAVLATLKNTGDQ
jgi:uncharacterized protein